MSDVESDSPEGASAAQAAEAMRLTDSLSRRHTILMEALHQIMDLDGLDGRVLRIIVAALTEVEKE